MSHAVEMTDFGRRSSSHQSQPLQRNDNGHRRKHDDLEEAAIQTGTLRDVGGDDLDGDGDNDSDGGVGCQPRRSGGTAGTAKLHTLRSSETTCMAEIDSADALGTTARINRHSSERGLTQRRLTGAAAEALYMFKQWGDKHHQAVTEKSEKQLAIDAANVEYRDKVYMSCRWKTRDICDNPSGREICLGFFNKIVNFTLIIAILGSILFFVLDSFNIESFSGGFCDGAENPNRTEMVADGTITCASNLMATCDGDCFHLFEMMFTIIFSLEFGVRIVVSESYCRRRQWTWHLDKAGAQIQKLTPDRPFLADAMNYCDLVAILPFFVEEVLGAADSQSSALGALKLLRVVRVFKIARHFNGSKVMWLTVKMSARGLMVAIFFLGVFLFLSSIILQVIDPCMSASKCTFVDPINGAYYVVITMSTVGYGDQVPQKTFSRLAAALFMFFGTFYIAMPLAVVGNNFEAAYKLVYGENAPTATISSFDRRQFIMNQAYRLRSLIEVGRVENQKLLVAQDHASSAAALVTGGPTTARATTALDAQMRARKTLHRAIKRMRATHATLCTHVDILTPSTVLLKKRHGDDELSLDANPTHRLSRRPSARARLATISSTGSMRVASSLASVAKVAIGRVHKRRQAVAVADGEDGAAAAGDGDGGGGGEAESKTAPAGNDDAGRAGNAAPGGGGGAGASSSDENDAMVLEDAGSPRTGEEAVAVMAVGEGPPTKVAASPAHQDGGAGAAGRSTAAATEASTAAVPGPRSSTTGRTPGPRDRAGVGRAGEEAVVVVNLAEAEQDGRRVVVLVSEDGSLEHDDSLHRRDPPPTSAVASASGGAEAKAARDGGSGKVHRGAVQDAFPGTVTNVSCSKRYFNVKFDDVDRERVKMDLVETDVHARRIRPLDDGSVRDNSRAASHSAVAQDANRSGGGGGGGGGGGDDDGDGDNPVGATPAGSIRALDSGTRARVQQLRVGDRVLVYTKEQKMQGISAEMADERKQVRELVRHAKAGAAQRHCPDTLWLFLEAPAEFGKPKSLARRVALAVSYMRVVTVSLAVVGVVIQTASRLNTYGPDTTACSREAAAWCANVDLAASEPEQRYGADIAALNWPCYPQRCSNYSATEDLREPGRMLLCRQGEDDVVYPGILADPSAFPFYDARLRLNVSCIGAATETEEAATVPLDAFRDNHTVRVTVVGESPFPASKPTTSLLLASGFGNVPMCQRRPCVDNSDVQLFASEETDSASSSSSSLSWWSSGVPAPAPATNATNSNSTRQRRRLSGPGPSPTVVGAPGPAGESGEQQGGGTTAEVGEQLATNKFFGYLEVFFCSWCIVEYILGMIATRPPKLTDALGMKRWYADAATWIEVVSLLVCTTELVAVSVEAGSLAYTVWGMPFVDTFSHTIMRPLRVVVMIRLCVMMRGVESMKILARTVKETYERLAVPIFFLLVFGLLFAGLFYTFETLLQCTPVAECSDGSLNLTLCPGDDAFEDGVGTVIYYRHASDILMGPAEGELCPLQNMWDGIWLSFVTISTVGYGVKYPVTSGGKGVAMVAAAFGTIYLAMPLSIVGARFYSIYEEYEKVTSLRKARTKFQHAMGAVLTVNVKRATLGQVTRTASRTGDTDPLRRELAHWDSQGKSHDLPSYQEAVRTLKEVETEMADFNLADHSSGLGGLDGKGSSGGGGGAAAFRGAAAGGLFNPKQLRFLLRYCDYEVPTADQVTDEDFEEMTELHEQFLSTIAEQFLFHDEWDVAPSGPLVRRDHDLHF